MQQFICPKASNECSIRRAGGFRKPPGCGQRPRGEYSLVSVIAQGTAPPMPMPANTRMGIRLSRECEKNTSKVPTEKTQAPIMSDIFLPMISEAVPKISAPNKYPTNAAENTPPNKASIRDVIRPAILAIHMNTYTIVHCPGSDIFDYMLGRYRINMAKIHVAF